VLEVLIPGIVAPGTTIPASIRKIQLLLVLVSVAVRFIDPVELVTGCDRGAVGLAAENVLVEPET
jgi:hypothetical protein